MKGEGYKIHAGLHVKDGQVLHAGVKEVVDFGSNLQVHEKRSVTLILKNNGSFNFDFLWQIIYQGKKIGGYNASETIARRSVLPPYISISQMQGVAPQEGEVEFNIEYLFFGNCFCSVEQY